MKTIILLKDGSKFTFMKEGKTTNVKIGGNPIIYEVVKLEEPKKGERLKFEYDGGCCVDEFVSTSIIASIE